MNQRENAAATLKRSNPSWLPRGELFLARQFLDHCFPGCEGNYVEQLSSAASLLGLSVVGVDLNGELPIALLKEGQYKRLQKYFTVGYINGPVAQAIIRLGFQQAMTCIKKDKRTLSDMVSVILKDVEEKCRLAGENGLNAIALADDIAGNNGLLLSPDDLNDIVLPCYIEAAELIKANGLFSFFHSDGDTRAIIESLIGAGYDCIHPVDNQAGLDLYELKKTFGNRVSFMGHVDIINRDDRQIAQEIKRAEDTFKEGGLVLGSTCGLSIETISDRLCALYPQWKGLRQEA